MLQAFYTQLFIISISVDNCLIFKHICTKCTNCISEVFVIVNNYVLWQLTNIQS